MASQPWMRRRVQAYPMLRAANGSAFEKCQKCGVSVAIALCDMHIYECKARKKQKRFRDLDFINCGQCGMLVEIAIYDTHKCEGNHDDGDQDASGKRQKSTLEQSKPDNRDVVESPGEGQCVSKNPTQRPVSSDKHHLTTRNQPRSAFRFFIWNCIWLKISWVCFHAIAIPVRDLENFQTTCDSDDWFEIDRKGFQKWKDMTVEEKSPYVIEAARVDIAYQEIIEREMEEQVNVQVLFQTNCQDCSSVRQFYKRKNFR